MTYLQEDLKIISNSVYAAQLKGKKILITGATGLIGSLLARSLIDINAELFIVVRNVDKVRTIYGDSLEKIHVIRGDVTDNKWMDDINTDIDDSSGIPVGEKCHFSQ